MLVYQDAFEDGAVRSGAVSAKAKQAAGHLAGMKALSEEFGLAPGAPGAAGGGRKRKKKKHNPVKAVVGFVTKSVKKALKPVIDDGIKPVVLGDFYAAFWYLKVCATLPLTTIITYYT